MWNSVCLIKVRKPLSFKSVRPLVCTRAKVLFSAYCSFAWELRLGVYLLARCFGFGWGPLDSLNHSHSTCQHFCSLAYLDFGIALGWLVQKSCRQVWNWFSFRISCPCKLSVTTKDFSVMCPFLPLSLLGFPCRYN